VVVDCETCVVRGPACSDCVVTFLLGPPDWLVGEGLPGAEVAALAVLADSGLVPPLRLVPPVAGPGAAQPGAPRRVGTATDGSRAVV
jgi:hypothetical protein